jgi:prepilin-type N-terminal cleavage/methylation domain-containing protein
MKTFHVHAGLPLTAGHKNAKPPDDPSIRPPGFTLIELLVVIFILSLTMVIAFPAFQVTERKTKSEARKVASLLRHLSDSSATRKETLPLKFDLDENTITWSDGGKRESQLEHLFGVELQTRGLIKEGELTVFFSPVGLGEHMWVYLGHGEDSFTVTFNPVSGRVKILEGHG